MSALLAMSNQSMTDRIFDLSERPMRLHVRSSLLVLGSDGLSMPAIPLSE